MMMFRRLLKNSCAVLTLLTGIACRCLCKETIDSNDMVTIDTVNNYIEFSSCIHLQRFNNGHGLSNHHFIVWEKGRAADFALFTTMVSDSTVHDALLTLGAKPGNTLRKETWTHRKRKKSIYPDMLVEGSGIKLQFVRDGVVYEPTTFLKDQNNRLYDFRFGGNRSFIKVWKSGCIVCLQSCPGGKIGNRTYSIRDLVSGKSLFSVNQGSDFSEGDTFTVRMSLLLDKGTSED